MSAGQLSSPIILAVDPSKILNQKKMIVAHDCLFEIDAPSPDCKIFFTINKERPASFDLPKKIRKMTVPQRNTVHYKKYFWLTSGKRTIKAMAIDSKGRESNVVTRVFTVSDPCNSDYTSVEEYRCADAIVEDQIKPKRNEIQSMTFSERGWNEDQTQNSIFFEEPIAEPELPKCLYCSCEYALSAEEARFCSQCSKPIPRYNECEPEKVYPGCTGVCTKCSSLIPLDASNCPVCDEPIQERSVESCEYDMNGDRICDACSRKSAPTATHCQFCDKKFPIPVMLGQAIPPRMNPAAMEQICTGCERRCAPEARICDWCGVPLATAENIQCVICFTELPPFVTFCAVCGVHFDSPPRLDPRNSSLGEIATLPFEQLPRWSTGPLPIVEYEETPRPTRDSPTSIIPKYANKAIQAPPILKPSRTNSTLPHSRPNKSISVISSGSGLWRKQLEHILTHHENHANKDTVYRQKVADLRMGSVVESEIGLSADPETDQQYMSIVLSFASPDNPDYPSSKSSSAWELYKTSPVKKTQENPNQEKKKKKAKKAAPKTTAEKILEALSHEERLLLAEVGSRGQHRLGQVALLLDSGKFEKLSNINCQNEKGVTPLYLAVSGNHNEICKLLINAILDKEKHPKKKNTSLNTKFGKELNTILHVATEQGNILLVQTLLESGASMKLKNRKDQTAFDLAQCGTSSKITNLFNQHQGRLLLESQLQTNQLMKGF